MPETKYIINNSPEQTISGILNLTSISANTIYTNTGQITQPYKIYTAFITQSGGEDIQTVSSGTVFVGYTYTITNYVAGDDFTNVGASSNANGVTFVATNITPSVWTNGSELTYDVGAPVVNILENKIGNITWSRVGAGVYYGTLVGAFPTKNLFFTTRNTLVSLDNGEVMETKWNDNDSFEVRTKQNGTPTDSLINGIPLEIKLYS